MLHVPLTDCSPFCPANLSIWPTPHSGRRVLTGVPTQLITAHRLYMRQRRCSWTVAQPSQLSPSQKPAGCTFISTCMELYTPSCTRSTRSQSHPAALAKKTCVGSIAVALHTAWYSCDMYCPDPRIETGVGSSRKSRLGTSGE